MIATMASGNVHIISHPGNPKYPVDIPAIAQRQRSTTWRWKSTTPLSFIRVKAAKPTAANCRRRA
jgi:histidinol phosphatase-like PHP family hydrolase